jgi:hypothetical protein
MGNAIAKFGYKQNMKLKSVKDPSILLATKWNLMQPFFFKLIIRKPLNISFHIFEKIRQLTTKKNVDTNMPIDFKEELILRGGPIENTSNYGIDIRKKL